MRKQKRGAGLFCLESQIRTELEGNLSGALPSLYSGETEAQEGGATDPNSHSGPKTRIQVFATPLSLGCFFQAVVASITRNSHEPPPCQPPSLLVDSVPLSMTPGAKDLKTPCHHSLLPHPPQAASSLAPWDPLLPIVMIACLFDQNCHKALDKPSVE